MRSRNSKGVMLWRLRRLEGGGRRGLRMLLRPRALLPLRLRRRRGLLQLLLLLPRLLLVLRCRRRLGRAREHRLRGPGLLLAALDLALEGLVRARLLLLVMLALQEGRGDAAEEAAGVLLRNVGRDAGHEAQEGEDGAR